MDLVARLQQLEDMVQEAKSMPLSSSVLVNREELLELLEAMQERAARGDQAGPLGRARPRGAAGEGPREGETHRREGPRGAAPDGRSRRRSSRARREEAERIAADAEDRARQMRLEAEDYVDAKLAQFEIALRRS